MEKIFIKIKVLCSRITSLPLSYIICKVPLFKKKKIFLLATWNAVEKRTPWDNYLYPTFFKIWIETEYWKVKNPDKSEELKALCMGGDSGRNWAKYYNNNPVELMFSQKKEN